MGFKDNYPVLADSVHNVFDSIGDIKLGLKDGHLDMDEIVEAIPDQRAQEAVRELLGALKALPEEFTRLMKNPWVMMTEFAPFLMAEAQGIFK